MTINHVRFYGALLGAFTVVFLVGCAQEIAQADHDALGQAKTEVYFNYPGSRAANGWNTEAMMWSYSSLIVQMLPSISP